MYKQVNKQFQGVKKKHSRTCGVLYLEHIFSHADGWKPSASENTCIIEKTKQRETGLPLTDPLCVWTSKLTLISLSQPEMMCHRSVSVRCSWQQIKCWGWKSHQACFCNPWNTFKQFRTHFRKGFSQLSSYSANLKLEPAFSWRVWGPWKGNNYFLQVKNYRVGWEREKVTR